MAIGEGGGGVIPVGEQNTRVLIKAMVKLQ